MKTINLII